MKLKSVTLWSFPILLGQAEYVAFYFVNFYLYIQLVTCKILHH